MLLTVIFLQVWLMLVSHPWCLCQWFFLVCVKHHVYLNYVHPFAMFTCCSYFISCSKVVTLIICADVCIKLLLWCLIVSDPCFICYSSHGMQCSLLCVFWCHALICHDMVAVHIVIELLKCNPAVFCLIPWYFTKSGIWFSCLACFISFHPWVFWPQVPCMNCLASCRLHVHIFHGHVAVVLLSLLLLFIEHVYNSLPWPLFCTKSVIWISSLASLLHAYPSFFWA